MSARRDWPERWPRADRAEVSVMQRAARAAMQRAAIDPVRCDQATGGDRNHRHLRQRWRRAQQPQGDQEKHSDSEQGQGATQTVPAMARYECAEPHRSGDEQERPIHPRSGKVRRDRRHTEEQRHHGAMQRTDQGCGGTQRVEIRSAQRNIDGGAHGALGVNCVDLKLPVLRLSVRRLQCTDIGN